MNIFEMTPQQLATFSLVLSMKIYENISDVDQKFLIASFFGSIGQNISLMVADEVVLKVLNNTSNNSTTANDNQNNPIDINEDVNL